MDDLFFEESLEVTKLQEMDRGTLSPKGARAFKASLTKESKKYTEYFQRVGPGFSNLTIEIKKQLDRKVLPEVLGVLSKITDGRFTQGFCDVRIYPQSRPFDRWLNLGEWNGEVIDIVVAFVLSVPGDDILDSMIRMKLLGLFEEDPWDPDIKRISKKIRLNKKLNVDEVVGITNDCIFEDFNPDDFGGMTLEILFDGCSEDDFHALALRARGPEIQSKRKRKETDPLPTLRNVNLRSVKAQVPVLISLLANELGVKDLCPKKLKGSDNLHALLGFNSDLTNSLVASLMAHFDVLQVVGASRMVTVGNAIDFVREIIESRQEG